MPNYLQMALFFVYSETYNQKESTIFQQFAAVSGCVNFHVGTFRVQIRLLGKFKFPAQTSQTTNKSSVLITNLQSAIFS